MYLDMIAALRQQVHAKVIATTVKLTYLLAFGFQRYTVVCYKGKYGDALLLGQERAVRGQHLLTFERLGQSYVKQVVAHKES